MNTVMIEALKDVLADHYALYLKTQNYHWNVEGPNFKALHLLFEEQYLELANAIDTAAELIRTLGVKAPATFEAYMKRTRISAGNEQASAEQMLRDLIADQDLIEKTLTIALEAAHSAENTVVESFVVERLSVHQKAAWMLKSSL